MATYTERVQTVLTPEQYERLSKLAEEQRKPLSVLIREAVERTYFLEMDRERRRQALDQLLALEAPVADWSQMEDEIEKGVLDE
ncbi:MAG TPA: ribbon-helix-helix domain-containing protein [Candidatus Sulfomarinibacteraceae bacterium]|nr:ribbon-helix-helix domain-containing protein [Candidatus Sulfomarinibacteraceae bacterium]